MATIVDGDIVHTLEFTKNELTVIFNVLVHTKYSLADAPLVYPIIDKIQPIVVTEGAKVEEKKPEINLKGTPDGQPTN